MFSFINFAPGSREWQQQQQKQAIMAQIMGQDAPAPNSVGHRRKALALIGEAPSAGVQPAAAGLEQMTAPQAASTTQAPQLGIDANYAPGAPAYTTEAGQRVVQTLLNPQPMAGPAAGGAPAASQPQPSTAGPLPLLDDVFDARFGSPPANPPPPVESPGMQALAQPGGEQQDPAAMRWLFNQEPQAGASMGSAPGVGSQPPVPASALSAHNVDPTLPMAGAVGNNTPPPSGNVPMELLVEALSNQFLPPEVKAFAAAQLQQQMKQQEADRQRAFAQQQQAQELARRQQIAQQIGIDPSLAADPEAWKAATGAQFQDRRMSVEGNVLDRNNNVVFQAPQKPTGGMQEYEAYAADERAAGRQPLGRLEYEQALRSSGATRINNNIGEGDKFYENLDRKNAETFSALSEAGVQGRTKMRQIDRLDELLSRSPQGASAMLKQIAGEYGINTEGLSDLQAAQALINELVPQQRQPGSGPMSDADLALYKASLVRLINQPDGNKLIIETMRDITRYQIQMGDIADLVADREISPAEGRKMIRELSNPLADFAERAEALTGGGDASSPRPGAVVDGHRFKGGDPADPNNWERQ